MHPASDPVSSVRVYQPGWSLARFEGHTTAWAAPVVHLAATSPLLLQIEKELLGQGIEISEGLPGTRLACGQDRQRPACVVIDIDMQKAGLCSVLDTFAGRDQPPVLLIGQCDDTRALVRAIKAGAFDFLRKPLDRRELVKVILAAIEQDRRQELRREEERVLRRRIASLTPREREVLPLVIGGLLNKQAAFLLGISEITLQIHRGQVMRKMQANSLADLVRMCVKLRIRHWRPTA